MPTLETLPSPGQIVRARARRYLVEEVTLRPAPGDDTRVRLACLDDDAQGEALEVLWERELDAEVLSGASWAGAKERGFDEPSRFAAYLHALRWGCVTATNPRLFQAPHRAGIQVRAYQLEPLRKALALPYASLFVADDVGLGKTIEAGLVLRELMLRQKVRRVVVAAPPSVVLQWQGELLRALRPAVRHVRPRLRAREAPRARLGHEPVDTTHTCFILSHALLRDEAYASLLRDWITADDHLKPGGPRARPLHPRRGAQRRAREQREIRHRLAAHPRRARDRAALRAPPLPLRDAAQRPLQQLLALLEILDPQRFCRGVPVVPRHRDTVMVRRLKADAEGDRRELPDPSRRADRHRRPAGRRARSPADAPAR
jgi:hypothetical protein